MNSPVIKLGKELSLQDIWHIILNPQNIIIDETVKNKIIRCRKVLDKLNSDHKPVYGVSTGFGHLENKWIHPDKQSRLQINLIRSHAIGVGEQIPKEITRLAMILLINSLAKGYSGIQLKTLERILFFVKEDLIPVTYTIGSLGASGDLAPLAHIALSLLGEGEIQFQDKRYSTNEILNKFKLEPLELQAKEGLALINGTHFITAYSLFILKRCRLLLQHSLIASALSIEALRATDTPFDERIAMIRGHPGHVTISRLMRDILKGSHIIASHKDPLIDHKTQDAYAIRCIPQVMGAIWDVFSYLERTLSIEINAVTDNPLIFPNDKMILSGGNFHAEPLGFPLEATVQALVEMANITEARIARLVSPFTPELPAFLASSPGIESGYMIAHYTVAAMVNKLRGLSHPNITDNIPVSGSQEDHVSMVMTTAARTWEVLGLVEDCVTFEIMMAIRGLTLVDHLPSSALLNSVLSLVEQEIIFEEQDHIIRSKFIEFSQLRKQCKILQLFNKYVEFPDSFNQ